MSESYVVAYTLFPKGYGGFKTRFNAFNNKKQAINFYNRLQTDNKCFYKSVEKDKISELLGDE